MTDATMHAVPFEDTIDGYFPLQISLGQMMQRHGFVQAFVSLRHQPMMEIPGLAATDPVPLNISAGRAGMIEELRLFVRVLPDDIWIGGEGAWVWFAGADTAVFDPMTRLAEPAIVSGVGFETDADLRGNAAAPWPIPTDPQILRSSDGDPLALQSARKHAT